MANKMMIKDLEEAIKFGWRLATVEEMEANLNLVTGQVMGINEIYLSNGSWAPGARRASPREMKVLAFVTGEPNFKIRPKGSEEIGKQGWRVACVAEVDRYQKKVKDLFRKKKLKEKVLLSDGWTDQNGSIARQGISNAVRVLLIETPIPPDTGASSSV